MAVVAEGRFSVSAAVVATATGPSINFTAERIDVTFVMEMSVLSTLIKSLHSVNRIE